MEVDGTSKGGGGKVLAQLIQTHRLRIGDVDAKKGKLKPSDE